MAMAKENNINIASDVSILILTNTHDNCIKHNITPPPFCSNYLPLFTVHAICMCTSMLLESDRQTCQQKLNIIYN